MDLEDDFTKVVMTDYIPIFFQSIDGVSAAASGVRNLPLILGACMLQFDTQSSFLRRK